MKQKILSAILVSAVILSMTGCGGAQPTEIPNNSQESEVTASTTSATTEKQEQTTTAATTTTTEPVKEEPPREIKNITKYNSFENGTLFFEIGNTGYVYDVLENKMYDYDSTELKNLDYACGKLVTDCKTTTNLETMKAYDVKLFESYDGFGGGPRLDTYNPVYSVKEDFDGNVYSFGILGSNGEWILPMSTEYSVCDLLKSNKYLYANMATSSFVVFSVGYDHYFYNYKTDEMVELDNPGYWSFADNYVILYDYDYDYKYNRIYNTNTKETIELGGEYNHLTGRANCVCLTNRGDCDNSVILDDKGNVLDYDLSEYIVNNYGILDATEDYIVFSAKNTDGDTYVIILDNNGNRIVDPIRETSRTNFDDICIYGNYVIDTYSEYIVNCKTGEMKTYSDENLSLEGFDSTSGKLIMKSDGNYYLADPSDPETLINPFEIAEIQ